MIDWFSDIILPFLFLAFGVLATHLYYKKSQREKSPNYVLDSLNIFNQELGIIDGLSFSYKDKTVKNLTQSKFIIWNEGKETVKRDDIAKKNPADN
ncbi:MAG: hypothetical protein D8M58_13305 [Calditrichaeota bacterium]|nr:MAG: hypothetical protein DWQ03_00270 [Calditrichota bacterium]MBL1206375.1 hypothetical protein [Calditrichota bacterium]NOG46201.1 hypothetical protein [Calditrichota bacterium]